MGVVVEHQRVVAQDLDIFLGPAGHHRFHGVIERIVSESPQYLCSLQSADGSLMQLLQLVNAEQAQLYNATGQY